MADYVRLTGTPHYIGAASDTKPTSCPSGSRCYEHDIEKWYITYNGGTNWVEMATKVVQPTAADLNATVTPAGWTISGEQTVGTNVIKASAGILHGFFIETDGDNDVTVQLYNHASAATNPITPSIVLPATDRFAAFLDVDANCTNGIVEVHSGTNGIVTALYL